MDFQAERPSDSSRKAPMVSRVKSWKALRLLSYRARCPLAGSFCSNGSLTADTPLAAPVVEFLQGCWEDTLLAHLASQSFIHSSSMAERQILLDTINIGWSD